MIFAYICSIRLGVCSATFGNATYDLSPLAQAQLTQKLVVKDFTFYIKLCGAVPIEELPVYSKVPYGYSVVACIDKNYTCYGADLYFDHELLPMQNEEGVVYRINGQPISVDGQDLQFVLSYSVLCDRNVTGDKLTSTVNVFGNNVILDVTMHSADGCPKKGRKGSVQHGAGEECQLWKSGREFPRFGIELDFDDYDSVSLFKVNGKSLLFRPCKAMECPGNECSDTEATAWLCDEKFERCDKLGDRPKVELQADDLSDGVRTEYDNISLITDCQEDFPYPYFYWADTVLVKDGKYIIAAGMADSCIKEFPLNGRGADKCVANFSNEQYVLNFNITAAGVAHAQVEMEGVSNATFPFDAAKEYVLWYAPCGQIKCPGNCFGENESSLWICSYEKCHSFGDVGKRIDIKLANMMPSGGVLVSYASETDLTADVLYMCDRSMQPGEVAIDKTVQLLENKHLLLTATSADACETVVVPGPTPTPFVPVFPVPTYAPTPPPPPSVSAPLKFIFNESRYIDLDLSSFDQKLQRIRNNLVYSTQSASFEVMLSPWTLEPCPEGSKCFNFDAASGWGCYTNDSLYCFPIADIRNGFDAYPIDPDALDKGVFLTYYGAYGLTTIIRLECNRLIDRELISFNTITQYHNTKDSVELYLYGRTNHICSKPFYRPSYPSVQDPVPSPGPKVKEVGYTANGKTVALNLEELPSSTVNVHLHYADVYEKSVLHISFDSPTACPEGFYCNGTREAYMWKCFNTSSGVQACHSIGDLEAPISVSRLNGTGLAVDFSDRYFGYHTVISFKCADSNEFRYNSLGAELPNKTIKLTLWTNASCAAPTKSMQRSLVYAFAGILGAIVVYGCAVCIYNTVRFRIFNPLYFMSSDGYERLYGVPHYTESVDQLESHESVA